MSKYKLKIVPENGRYVGYALENDEVKAKTEPCQNSSTASRHLSILIASLDSSPSTNQPKVFSVGSTTRQAPPPSAPQPQPSAPARKCCGRG
jgi:hypothetical protein